MKELDLYFIRHGQTEWNKLGKFQGQKNSPLSELGIAQARNLNKTLERLNLSDAKRLSSPAGRAVETANIVFGSEQPFVTDERLQEISFGDWEGLRFDQIANQWSWKMDDPLWQFQSPGGEDYETISRRVQSFLDEISGTAVIVSHSTTGRVLRGLYLGLDKQEVPLLDTHQGCIIRLSGGTETVICD